MVICVDSLEHTKKPYLIICRDFVESPVHCITGPHNVTCGTALIARDMRTGQEGPIGPICAAKQAFQRDAFFPDYTRAVKDVASHTHDDRHAEKDIEIRPACASAADPSATFNRQSVLTRRQQNLLSVSLLRVHKLPSVGITFWSPNEMHALVNRWERGEEITPHLWGSVETIQKAKEEEACAHPVRASLAFADLMTAYAVRTWILRLKKKGLNSCQLSALREVEEKQMKYRRLYPREYNSLLGLSRLHHVKPFEIDARWLRSSNAALPKDKMPKDKVAPTP